MSEADIIHEILSQLNERADHLENRIADITSDRGLMLGSLLGLAIWVTLITVYVTVF